MVKEQIETGKTVEQAIEAACEKLGLSQDEVQVEVLEVAKKGFLGFGAAPAKVRVYKEYSKSARAVEYLKEVLAGLRRLDTATMSFPLCIKRDAIVWRKARGFYPFSNSNKAFNTCSERFGNISAYSLIN